MTKGSDLELGQVVVGKYRLLQVLGEGGMGVVYLAEHELIEKRVALKVLRKEYSDKSELVQRFKQEAISASRIKHPNVLDVFDFGQLENGCFFLAMEYLQGRDLAAELSQNTVVEPVMAVRLALQMCRALGSAHSRGVVHRDMKPENVFLHRTEEGDEIVKIVDFGIAQLRGRDDQKQEPATRRRLTRTGVIFGTPEYMSPEQAAGRNADLRVDVYAVGVILYEMFTGAVPFTGDSFMAVLSAHLTQPVPPMRSWVPDLAISSELEAVVMKSLAKNPDERYQSMSEFAQDLQQSPEGRLAAPLAALLPIPRVTHESFRPARGNSAATAPHFVLGRAPATMGAGADASVPIPIDDESAITATDLSTIHPRAGMYRARFGLVLVGAALLLGATAFGFRYWRSTNARAASVRVIPPPVVALPSSAPPITEIGAEAGVSSVPHAGVVAADQVTLTVATEPAGAVLFKGGFQVCDSTPCTIAVSAGEAMELEGRKGTFKGVLKVLAQRNQSVNIVLIPAPPMIRRPAKNSSNSKLCEVVVDGLKILRPCPP